MWMQLFTTLETVYHLWSRMLSMGPTSSTRHCPFLSEQYPQRNYLFPARFSDLRWSGTVATKTKKSKHMFTRKDKYVWNTIMKNLSSKNANKDSANSTMLKLTWKYNEVYEKQLITGNNLLPYLCLLVSGVFFLRIRVRPSALSAFSISGAAFLCSFFVSVLALFQMLH